MIVRAMLWRVHALLRLFWGPEAYCPVPRQHLDAETGRLDLIVSAVRRYPNLYTGLALLFLVVILAIIAPVLIPFSADQVIPNSRLMAPSPLHPFGTDALGRDLLSRVSAGAWLAAKIGLFSVTISLAAGLVLGSLAGYYSGWLDQLLSRMMDGWLALPGALVAVVIVARLGASLDNLIVALGVMGIPAFYRIVRTSTLSAKQMPYAEAATALGATDHRVMWHHVFPNILSPVVVLTSMRLGTVLLTGSSLSFIGLGAQPPAPEWGSLLATGRNYLGTAWWLAVFPGMAMTITVVGLNLVGDGLRDVLDPRRERSSRMDGVPEVTYAEPIAPVREARSSDLGDVVVVAPRRTTKQIEAELER